MQPGPAEEPLQTTTEYLPHELAEKQRTQELWQRIVKYEAMHPISLKVGTNHLGALEDCALACISLHARSKNLHVYAVSAFGNPYHHRDRYISASYL